MGLPLFKGVSRERMSKTVGVSKFHFLKYPDGEVIYRAGDPCTDLTFILSGMVNITVADEHNKFSVSQIVSAKDVISPEFLFGRHTSYPGTAVAVGPVSLLRISKSDYINILNSDTIFLLNYLNQLSVSSQKSIEGILAVSVGSLAERIALWISTMTQARSHDIVLKCSRCDLSALFGVSHSVLSDTLDDLAEQGLIEYTSDTIKVLDRPRLISLLRNHAEAAE